MLILDREDLVNNKSRKIEDPYEVRSMKNKVALG